jgi:hypothetical protein
MFSSIPAIGLPPFAADETGRGASRAAPERQHIQRIETCLSIN